MSSPMGVCSIRSMCEIQHFFLSDFRDQGGIREGCHWVIIIMLHI